MEARVEAVCLGKLKSQPKQEQPEITLHPGVGVIGDAHVDKLVKSPHLSS
ncbi:MAG: hypothetical protein V2A69_02265 [Pseudomonadota bacterium]